jgi:hypothetical protein
MILIFTPEEYLINGMLPIGQTLKGRTKLLVSIQQNHTRRQAISTIQDSVTLRKVLRSY